MLRVADSAPLCAGRCLCTNCPCQTFGQQGFGLPSYLPGTGGLLPNLVPFLASGDWAAPSGPSYLQGLKDETFPGTVCAMSNVGASASAQQPLFPAPQQGFRRLVLGASYEGVYLAAISPNTTYVHNTLFGGNQWCSTSQNSMFVYALQNSPGDILSSSVARSPAAMQCSEAACIAVDNWNYVSGAQPPGRSLPFSKGYFGRNPMSAAPWFADAYSSSPVTLADLKTYHLEFNFGTQGGDSYGDTLLLSTDGRVRTIPSAWNQVYADPGSPWVAANGMPWLTAKFWHWNSAPDYLALARGTQNSLCLLTKALSVECYSVLTSQGHVHPDAVGPYRSEGPWIPTVPLVPVLFLVGLRGKDEVCVHVPHVENYSPNTIAVQQASFQYMKRCN